MKTTIKTAQNLAKTLAFAAMDPEIRNSNTDEAATQLAAIIDDLEDSEEDYSEYTVVWEFVVSSYSEKTGFSF